jgi:hypothetical protein
MMAIAQFVCVWECEGLLKVSLLSLFVGIQ